MKAATTCLLVSMTLSVVLVLPSAAVEVQQNNVAVREGPGAYYPVIHVAHQGDHLDLLKGDNENWKQVRLPEDAMGWIPARAFEKDGARIDYGAMATALSDRTPSRTMVTAAIKGFFESKIESPEVNSERMKQPFCRYFTADQYRQFKGETGGEEWKYSSFKERKLAKSRSGFQIDERTYATSSYLVGRLTAPGLSAQPQKLAYLNEVAQLVAEHTEYYDLPVTVHLVKSPRLFCNALPIGVVVLSEGMLKMVSSENELACLFGHELAHVTLQHGAEELEKRKVRLHSDKAFEELDKKIDFDTKELEDLAFEMFEKAIRGRKEVYESQADLRGALYAFRAGYDPRGMVTLLKRLQAGIPKSREPGDLSHWLPGSLERRIQKLEDYIEKKIPNASKGAERKDRFVSRTTLESPPSEP